MTEDVGTEKGEDSKAQQEPEPQEAMGPKIIPFPEVSGLDEGFEFGLPVGSFDLSNEYYRTLELKPLGGATRKKIGRPDILNTPGKLITALLYELAEFPHFKYNDKKAEKKLIIKSMYSADRSACLLAIRKATKGNEPIVQRTKCPACPAHLELQTLPTEIDTIRIEDTDYKIKQELHDVILSILLGTVEENTLAEFTLSRGFNEERMTAEQLKNLGEQTYHILAQCTKSYDGHVVDEDFYAHKLPVAISDILVDQFTANQPGPDTFLEATCTECGVEFDYAVEPSDFLFPNVRTKQSRRRGRRSRR